MSKILKKLGWKVTVLLGIIILLLLLIGANQIIKLYFIRTIESGWNVISTEKDGKIKNDCLYLFDRYQQQTISFSSRVANNYKFLSSFISQNPRKTYDAYHEISGYDEFYTEAYNSRLELFIYSGRQLFPDILELQRALKGERFTTIKESGFYTYLLSFEPLNSEDNPPGSMNQVQGGEKVTGVLVVGKLIDVNYKINNSFFKNYGFIQDISSKYDITAAFENKPFSDSIYSNEENLHNVQKLDLKGSDGSVISRVILPRLDKNSYISGVEDEFQKLFSILIFGLSAIIFVLILNYSQKIELKSIKLSIYVSYLLLTRFFWLSVEFPANIFKTSLFEVFSPSHYASGFGFGIGKSLGELFITSLFVLVICFIILSYTFKSLKKDTVSNNIIFKLIIPKQPIFINFCNTSININNGKKNSEKYLKF